MKLSVVEWIGMLLSILTFCAGVAAWGLSTFAQKEDVYRRLDRIEHKVDQLLEGR